MGSLGIPELVVIVTILVLVFGANRLPELARGMGRGIRNFKDATREGMKDHDAESPGFLPPHSTIRASPARRVTRSRSRYSSSGIANFRVMP